MAYEVHVEGLLLCAQEVLSSMRKRKTGSVLVTGNAMSLRGGPTSGVDAPSKFAQRVALLSAWHRNKSSSVSMLRTSSLMAR
jgi:NADP-dependent 3-hydroxy acid dehydrogenase YdfG